MVANPETSATYEVFSFIDRQNQNHQIIVVTIIYNTNLLTILYCLTLQITILSLSILTTVLRYFNFK